MLPMDLPVTVDGMAMGDVPNSSYCRDDFIDVLNSVLEIEVLNSKVVIIVVPDLVNLVVET